MKIIVAAGVCKLPKSILSYQDSLADIIVAGSYTPEERIGNKGKVFFPHNRGMKAEVVTGKYLANSFGMPNPGFKKVDLEFTKIKKNIRKQLFISIAGFSVSDYVSGVEFFNDREYVSGIELNLSCPNTESSQLFCFNLAQTERILNRLRKVGLKKTLWLKVSVFSDEVLLKNFCILVNEYADIVDGIVTSNTLPNTVDAGVKFKSRNALGGMSGSFLKPIVLGQVRLFRLNLHQNIKIIGVGGIMKKSDVLLYKKFGSDMVQVNSLLFWGTGPKELPKLRA